MLCIRTRRASMCQRITISYGVIKIAYCFCEHISSSVLGNRQRCRCAAAIVVWYTFSSLLLSNAICSRVPVCHRRLCSNSILAMGPRGGGQRAFPGRPNVVDRKWPVSTHHTWVINCFSNIFTVIYKWHRSWSSACALCLHNHSYCDATHFG